MFPLAEAIGLNKAAACGDDEIGLNILCHLENVPPIRVP